MLERLGSSCARALPLPVLLALLAGPVPAAETGWPHWRGPTGNGVSPDGAPPVEIGESKNLAWKVEIPGRGTASPVVLGDRIFVSTAIPVPVAEAGADAGAAAEKAGPAEPQGRGRSGRGGGRGGALSPQRFTVLCLDRATGKTLWTRTAVEATPGEGHHPSHGFASASPCTDGERVYAHFGSRGLFCLDMDGKEVWKRTDFGQMRTRNTFGEGSSPTVHGEKVLVPWDHEGPSCLIALDRKTGNTLWKTDRDEPSCWATPLVVEHGGKKQVVMNGQTFARGYDLETGKELWRCGGQTQRPVASPVAGHGLVFVGSGFQGSFLAAFRLDRTGSLEGTDGVVWSIDRDTPDVPSPLLSGTRLYFHSARRGSISCLDATTKKAHYSVQRVDAIREVYASPVAANGKAYLTGRDGTIVVIEDADAFQVVATSKLDEGVDATPAIAGKQLFVRGERHLYCFAEGAKPGS